MSQTRPNPRTLSGQEKESIDVELTKAERKVLWTIFPFVNGLDLVDLVKFTAECEDDDCEPYHHVEVLEGIVALYWNNVITGSTFEPALYKFMGGSFDGGSYAMRNLPLTLWPRGVTEAVIRRDRFVTYRYPAYLLEED